ncbi:MAG: FAD-dependent oxidoreductase, partial [Clostridia bacterium]|nr:FAD-dependent oxidoreductase [Clostridia bacterium]
NRETGILEELMLENYYRNPDYNYSVWDGVLYAAAAYQPGVELLLNCSCFDCGVRGGRIEWVKGWQTTTQTFHSVRAAIFADCSGDSVLAALSGAEYRFGREAGNEFGEDIAPETADRKTMGMSCMLQAREDTRPSAFTPPPWAYRYTKEDLPHRVPDMSDVNENFWYLELGGEDDAIADAEKTRDELLRVVYGVWDFVKNAPENREKNKFWRLDWVGILPGKRESRRCVGDYILTQNDVRSGGKFDDTVAYGGWPMDDHDPAGFRSEGAPTVFHPAPSPYGIPYRCLYSVNVENLMFAGRNISVTHTAMSSSRVMATCALLGQAVGTAAAIAVKYGETPRGVYRKHLRELQDALSEDDCYLPGYRRALPALTMQAKLVCPSPDAENLRSGVDRPLGGGSNRVLIPKGGAAEYRFGEVRYVSRVRLVFDSDLDRETLPEPERSRNRNMLHNRPLGWPDARVPATMTRAFRLEGVREDGKTETLADERNNYLRLRVFPIRGEYRAVRLTTMETWGAEACGVFAFEVFSE